MLKLISFTICPFVQRVTAALEVRNIPYEIEYISLNEKPQWFLDLAPNGQVPVLVTENGIALFESDAIVEYIEDKYGALEPSNTAEEKAIDRAWAYLGTKHYLPQCGAMSSKTAETFEERAEKLCKAFAKMEQQLSGETSFFKSNTLTNVDLAWLPLLHRAAIVKEKTGFDYLDCYPKMQAWQQAIMGSGLVNKTVSAEFTAKFSNFYLTNTYLASGAQGVCSSASDTPCCQC